MANGYVIPIDPSELANRFANPEEDPEESEDTEEEEAAFSAGSRESLQLSLLVEAEYDSRIEPLLNRIPQREADLIFLYFIQKKRQADIAEIFGVTQAAISYRLDRGLQRIKFLLSIPQVVEEDMREDLVDIFQPLDIDILVGMWHTTCQSEVASQLNLTQGRVRHRFFKSVAQLKEAAANDSKYEPYEKIFSAIAGKNFNILREVKLPQWSDRGGDECV